MPMLQTKESLEEVALKFLELIQTLLKDPEARQDFFMVRHYPVEPTPAVNIICYSKKDNCN